MDDRGIHVRVKELLESLGAENKGKDLVVGWTSLADDQGLVMD